MGNPLIGLSYINDVRVQEHRPLSLWQGRVQPETVEKGTPQWERWQLHNAANPLHLQEKFGFTLERPRSYHVAWIGGSVLFDRAKLVAAGGFSFWEDLPPDSCSEDILAQHRVMKHYGGCGVLPSGAYHQELPTTLRDRSHNALNLLPTGLNTIGL